MVDTHARLPPSASVRVLESTSERTMWQVELLTDRMETPSLDDRSYRVIRLPNQLEALLVHDPETDQASAAMDVNVGNFSDELDMPGMAHAVEHVGFDPTPRRINQSIAAFLTDLSLQVAFHGNQEVSSGECILAISLCELWQFQCLYGRDVYQLLL
jgi:hypothetical protein